MTLEQIISELEQISMVCSQNLSAAGMTLAENLKRRLSGEFYASHVLGRAVGPLNRTLGLGPDVTIGAKP